MRFFVFTVISVCIHLLLALAVLAPTPTESPVRADQPIDVDYQVVTAPPKPLPPKPQPPEPAPDVIPELLPDTLIDHSLPSKGKPTGAPPAPPKAAAPPATRARIGMEQLLAPERTKPSQPQPKFDPYRLEESDLQALADILNKESTPEILGAETSEVIHFDAISQKARHVSFLWQMKRKIENVWVYPRESIEREEQGAVLIRFHVNQDGSLDGVELIQNPSQSIFLANAAVKAVRDAAPYLPLPEPLERLTINGVFVYHFGRYYIYYR
ncbi:energy transducer TonB [Chrysiogenes arsenatis]|uniref:energy transducer TonB n=1 Tax=Chrysiogenes arsenatis TaxID=309797 RepID=UPI000411144C|nr:TonB family protein [Chrysiogenes arsenatis]